MVESVFPTGEAHVDSSIAEELMRFCPPDEPLAERVAKSIGTYLGQHPSDRINGYEQPRQRMFEWLHKLPDTVYQHAAEDLFVSAKKMADRDAWEACHFASLFAHFRAFRYERSLLDTIVKALPDEPRHDSFRGSLRQLATVAAGNVFLQAGDGDAAEASFTAGRGQV
jgi:hypothetical protein